MGIRVAAVNPLIHQLVQERRRDLANLAEPRPRRSRPRRSVSRSVGLALIRAGRRLAGPEEIQRMPAGSRSALSP